MPRGSTASRRRARSSTAPAARPCAMTASAWPCPARPTAPAWWGGGGGGAAPGDGTLWRGAGGGGVVGGALRLAMERYGERITVSGSVEFKAAAIRAAVDVQRPITFADPALELWGCCQLH